MCQHFSWSAQTNSQPLRGWVPFESLPLCWNAVIRGDIYISLNPPIPPLLPFFLLLLWTQGLTLTMPHLGPFDQILQVFTTADHYTIGNFLIDLFHASLPGSHATGRSECHGKMLSAFLWGATSYGVGEVLHQLDTVAGRFQDPQEPLYTLALSYKSLKSGCAALTSYMAQKVSHQLLIEQHKAVDPEGGLHTFAPYRWTEPVNMHLNWDTYSATTFEDI